MTTKWTMTSAAATLGQRLINEIPEESLDELLRDVRNQVPSPTETESGFFGIKDFDELLNVFLGQASPGNGTEANAQIQHAHAHAQPATSSDQRKWKRKNPVVEISSPSSGGGKSQLVYYLIAMSVLPATFHGHRLDGRGGAVVLLDTDGRLDVQRLYDIIKGVVRHALDGANDTSGDAANDASIDTLIRDSLAHIHIFRPQTSSSLLSTLQFLETYLLLHNPRVDGSRPLHGIFLDSASAFHWPDRLRDEIARTSEIGLSSTAIQQAREQRTSFRASVLYADVANELRRLQGVFGCGVVYTTWGVTPRSSSPSSFSSSSGPGGGLGGGGYGRCLWPSPPTFKPHLPPPWNSTFPDLTLVVQRDHVRTYPATSGMNECERDAPIRQSVVERGKFSAWVDTSNVITAWGGEVVLSALRRMPDNGGFPFWVRGDGVFMDDLMDDVA